MNVRRNTCQLPPRFPIIHVYGKSEITSLLRKPTVKIQKDRENLSNSSLGYFYGLSFRFHPSKSVDLSRVEEALTPQNSNREIIFRKKKGFNANIYIEHLFERIACDLVGNPDSVWMTEGLMSFLDLPSDIDEIAIDRNEDSES